MTHLIQYSEEVKNAKAQGLPLVALESTIISHGMPHPTNLEMAQTVEDIIRKQGVVPATITLFEGKIRVGMDPHLLHHFATSKSVFKASKRDLAYALTKRLAASTTVAATMYCAHLAGIEVFVTGGIGGVHQDVGTSFDISADVIELSRTPITVICSGAKSILDLAKTLEMLETYSVPVIGYGTDEFPAFFSHSSGINIPHRMDTIEQIHEFHRLHKTLKHQSGILITHPIPKAAEIPLENIEPLISQAINETHGIKGKAITPYLLQRINELSQGKTLQANVELIKNNAQFGALLAKKFILD